MLRRVQISDSNDTRFIQDEKVERFDMIGGARASHRENLHPPSDLRGGQIAGSCPAKSTRSSRERRPDDRRKTRAAYENVPGRYHEGVALDRFVHLGGIVSGNDADADRGRLGGI